MTGAELLRAIEVADQERLSALVAADTAADAAEISSWAACPDDLSVDAVGEYDAAADAAIRATLLAARDAAWRRYAQTVADAAQRYLANSH